MQRVEAIRAILREQQVYALVVPTEDAHQSEYVADCDQRRAFVSGFTGSAGTAVITLEEALLWTDGRYFLQATQELVSPWILMRSGDTGVPTMEEWLAKSVPAGESVAVDPFTFSAAAANALSHQLQKSNVTLRALDKNPVDSIWTGQPLPSSSPVAVHPFQYSGKNHSEKLAQLQTDLASQHAAALVICALDEIAWLFNIRGSDIMCNPVVTSYAIVTAEGAHLFVEPSKVTPALTEHLGEVVQLHAYDGIVNWLSDFIPHIGQKIVIADLNTLNWAVYRTIRAPGGVVRDTPSIIARLKAVKNQAEIEGIKAAHVRDGAALTTFLGWLQRTIASGPEGDGDGLGWPLTECSVSRKLTEFRSRMDKYVCESFPTIAGYGPNGAVIHYHAHEGKCAELGDSEVFLLDSGAQYLDGTTDITRTMHFGTPSPWEKECFTRVLKGHIALATAVFPEHTMGSRLDALARVPLWGIGLDYNHGTGHGVGAYLNVHEGPQGIGFRKRPNEMGFVDGMTISNEPGYYEEGAFGIRIENICISVPAETLHHFGNKRYLTFETVSFAPIQLNMVDVNLLTDAELGWLNNYHSIVRQKIGPLLESDPVTYAFLLKETQPLVR